MDLFAHAAIATWLQLNFVAVLVFHFGSVVWFLAKMWWQHYTTLYNSIQHYTTLYNTIQQYTTLYNTIQHYTTLYNTIQQYTTLYNTIQHYTTLYNTIQHYTTLYQFTARGPNLTNSQPNMWEGWGIVYSALYGLGPMICYYAYVFVWAIGRVDLTVHMDLKRHQWQEHRTDPSYM